MKLKIIYKKRDNNQNYLENESNKANKPIETKLKSLGWQCHFDCKRGFSNVLQYLLEKQQKS